MKIKIFLIVAIHLIILLSVTAMEANKIKNKKVKKMEDSSKEVFKINDKVVSIEEFTDFLNTLKEIPGTWFCAETKNGGRTGYDATDKDGIIYEYRSISEPGNYKSTITRKIELK